MPVPGFLDANVLYVRQRVWDTWEANDSSSRFPVADVLWTLVMAYDVFLIVFRRRDVEGLRKLEIKYICVITVAVFIPAFVFLFIRSPDKGPMYGAVTVRFRQI